ncbi:MAG: hypothetical protein ACOY3D_02715 [Candidatus Omnitrophota bacterium]
MKRAGLVWLILLIAGCVTVKVPKYINQDFPYRQDFAAGFDETFNATSRVLKELGWKITETANPASFDPTSADKRKQVLIFTEIRQTPMFLSTSYASLNVYLREMGIDRTQVEVRYLYVLPLPLRDHKNYQNDALVKKIFNKINERLKQ